MDFLRLGAWILETMVFSVTAMLCHVIMKLWEHIGHDRVSYRLHVSSIPIVYSIKVAGSSLETNQSSPFYYNIIYISNSNIL